MPLSEWEKVSRDDPYYKVCTVVTTAAGAIVGSATGSVLGPAGTVSGAAGGAAWGLAAGYLACPYLVPAIRKKIENGMALSDHEITSAAEAMGRYTGVHQASDAVKLVAVVKHIAGGQRRTLASRAPALTAKQLLEQLA